MKRFLCILTAILMILSLTACGSDKSGSTKDSSKKSSSSAAAKAAIDVDLTSMSSTMVYSEVLNMTQSPDSYKGKTVRMKGAFSVAEVGGQRYFACIIKDATACCAQGIEFVWAGDHTYPTDYPKQDEEITVTGTFTTYMEGGSRYLQLKDADLQF